MHWQTGVPVLNGLRREEMWVLVSQMRNAMGDNRVRARVYVHLDVAVDRVSISEEGLEAGC